MSTPLGIVACICLTLIAMVGIGGIIVAYALHASPPDNVVTGLIAIASGAAGAVGGLAYANRDKE